MRYTLFSLIALFLAMATLMLGSGHLGTFLSLRMQTAAFPDWLIGLVMSGYYMGLVAGAWTGHRIVQRVGHIRAFSVFAATNCVAVLMHALFVNPVYWMLLRVITGLSMMGLFMIVESWLNERSPREIRGKIFSVYMIVSYLGLGLGQFMLNIGPILEPVHYFVVGILFALCLLPVSLTRAMHPAPVEAMQFNWSRLYKTAPFGLIGALVAGLINGAVYSLAPIYARDLNLTVPQIAAFMAIVVFGGLLFQIPVGFVSDRVDRRSVLASLTVLVALASLALLVIPANWLWPLYAMAFLFGGLAFTVYPVAVAHTHDHFDANQVVVVSAALIVVYGLGASFGPLGASAIIFGLGSRGLFVFIATVALLYGVTAWLRRGFEAVPVEKQDPFVAVPSTSPVINTLDPRADEVQVTELTAEK